MLPYEENYDKAVYYLHHKTKLDYPAATNYFRKSAEEILEAHIPQHEIRDDKYAIIESITIAYSLQEGFKILFKSIYIQNLFTGKNRKRIVGFGLVPKYG